MRKRQGKERRKEKIKMAERSGGDEQGNERKTNII
jgi:hypothetical protein